MTGSAGLASALTLQPLHKRSDVTSPCHTVQAVSTRCHRWTSNNRSWPACQQPVNVYGSSDTGGCCYKLLQLSFAWVSRYITYIDDLCLEAGQAYGQVVKPYVNSCLATSLTQCPVIHMMRGQQTSNTLTATPGCSTAIRAVHLMRMLHVDSHDAMCHETSTAQHSTALCSTARHSTTLHCTAQHGTAWHGTE